MFSLKWRNYFVKHQSPFILNVGNLEERHSHRFDGMKLSIPMLNSLYVRMFFEWSYTLGPNDMHSVVNFMNSLCFHM